MNEQLTVKNFGPITEATVDFKRVTVFIGPTGGGKSTLAKLAAVFFGGEIQIANNCPNIDRALTKYSIKNYKGSTSFINWQKPSGNNLTIDRPILLDIVVNDTEITNDRLEALVEAQVGSILAQVGLAKDRWQGIVDKGKIRDMLINNLLNAQVNSRENMSTGPYLLHYTPTERVFVAAIEYSWPGLMRDDIGLSNTLLNFANKFSLSRKTISELDIPFLNVKYMHIDGRDFIKIPEREEPLMLLETASGIQSVIPLLVLLEHLSRNTEQAQSFIIEEPELNLFPLAQFELVKTLVDKCARLEGKNDLVLTTHSPYVLTALNLLCYAFRVAQQDEATAKKVARLIPRHCWIDPAQFSAYYVDRPGTKRKQQVHSIINKKTGLIEENELDTASDELSQLFDKLVRLRQPAKTAAQLN